MIFFSFQYFIAEILLSSSPPPLVVGGMMNSVLLNAFIMPSLFTYHFILPK